MKIRENTGVDLSIKNLIAIVSAVAIAVYAFFGIQERLNNIETNYKLIKGDIEKNTDFRIRWPLGEIGSLPADSEQFMLIEHMASQLEKIEAQMESMMHNKVNIERLQDDMQEARTSIEKLKDKVRANGGTH